ASRRLVFTACRASRRTRAWRSPQWLRPRGCAAIRYIRARRTGAVSHPAACCSGLRATDRRPRATRRSGRRQTKAQGGCSVGHPKITISELGVAFAGRGPDRRIDALQNVSLQVEDGEFVCLLGPSGCGKTTLLNCIAGFVEPTAGEILVNGLAVAG